MTCPCGPLSVLPNGEDYVETYLTASVSISKAHGGFQEHSSSEKSNDRERKVVSWSSKLEDQTGSRVCFEDQKQLGAIVYSRSRGKRIPVSLRPAHILVGLYSQAVLQEKLSVI